MYLIAKSDFSIHNEVLLDILLPTYNRSVELKRNINQLAEAIRRVDTGLIRVIISDNNSSDTTIEDVTNLIGLNLNLSIYLYKQISNVGLEKNTVDLVRISTAKYIMFLGDDDYISNSFLKIVIENIKKETVACIVPGFMAITQDERVIGFRDIGINKLYKKGFWTAYELAWRGHQLSGLTFIRDGLLDSYLKHEYLRNIYLFIYFVGYTCLKGPVLHLREHPVLVTVGEKKYWSYGNDALFNEKLKNIKMLFSAGFKRYAMEYKFYIMNLYSIKTIYGVSANAIRALILATMADSMSITTRVLTPLFLLYHIAMKAIYKFIGRITE
jgi:abequosyltransferase